MTRALALPAPGLALGLALLAAGCGSPLPGEVDGAAADTAVAAGDLAGGGACTPACTAAAPVCNAKGHCVGCATDKDCLPGTICKVISDTQASCVSGCTDDSRCAGGKKCCGGACADLLSDPANCGKCGGACVANHASNSCVAGVCKPGACQPGWGDCNGKPDDGCEANLHVDPMNCVSCGAKCAIANSLVACADGCYSSACNFGYDDCNGDPMDGCETSTLMDPANCGGCGTSCKNPPNASAACQGGACVLEMCTQGYSDCNGDAKDGCEINLLSSATHCGSCMVACPMGDVCMGGACTCPNCMNAFPNASAQCMNGQCIFDKCNLGYSNCDNNPMNGCEANVANDAMNCGQCKSVCPNNLPFCGNGMCQAMPLGCFRVADVAQAGTKMQFTSCGMVANNGFTCINPLIRYGNIPDGVPAMHGNDDFPTWCMQLGCKGYVANSVQYGNRSFVAPFGKLFWCSSYDENFPHWCDWQDGTWLNQQLDYHQPSADAITSITCN